MNEKCPIIKDLLPLYVENMLSEESKNFTEEHINTCEDCRKELLSLTHNKIESMAKQESKSEEPLRLIKKSLKKKNFLTILGTSLLLIAILVSVFHSLSSPHFIPYSKGLLTLEVSDNKVTTIFNDNVAVTYNSYRDGKLYINAYSSLMDKLGFSGNPTVHSMYFEVKPESIYYCSENGEAPVLLWGKDEEAVKTSTKHVFTLTYFLIFSLILALAFAVLIFIFSKNPALKKFFKNLIPLPLFYALFTLTLKGFYTSTYSLVQDFTAIVLFTAIAYTGYLILACKSKI